MFNRYNCVITYKIHVTQVINCKLQIQLRFQNTAPLHHKID